ncbi:MAG: hypothetical protein H6658_12390 [Ardenticatenaceae bacterium]|nr:hypothetical protein [Ardenticatenaceae bacterium]
MAEKEDDEVSRMREVGILPESGRIELDNLPEWQSQSAAEEFEILSRYDGWKKASEALPTKEGAEFSHLLPSINAQGAEFPLAVDILKAKDDDPPPPSHLMDIPTPLPSGGTEVLLIQVKGGSVSQVEDVLDEFSMMNRPHYHLIRHGDPGYWYIRIFADNDENKKAEALLETIKRGVLREASTARAQFERRSVKVGYVVIGDRPVIPLRFFALDEQYKDRIRFLAQEVGNELVKWGFTLVDGSKVANRKGEQTSVAAAEDEATPHKGKKRKRGPNIATVVRLEELRKKREEYRAKDGKINISRTQACQLVGIDPGTVRVNDPELWGKWDIKEFYSDKHTDTSA